MFQASGITTAKGLLPWSQVRGLKKRLFSPVPEIRFFGSPALPLAASPEEAEKSVPGFFRAWGEAEPARARKAAFDYADTNAGFYRLFFIFSLTFSLGVAAFQLKDSYDASVCTAKLRENSNPVEAQVVKAKKKRDGHFLLKLDIPTAQGTLIRGHDQWIQKGGEPGKTVTLLQAVADSHCWMLAPSPGEESSAWAKRRVFTAWSAMFGFCFLVFAAFGLIYSFFRLREKRPGGDKLLALFP